MTRILPLISVLFSLLSGCGVPAGEPADPRASPGYDDRRTIAEWDTLFSQRQLKGSVLLFDGATDSLYSNNFDWKATGVLPASTFKIANTAIGLEMGLLKDRHTIFPWDGTTRGVASWNEDMNLQEAFVRSCVPCYQGLARSIGADSMNYYLQLLDYGDIHVTADSIDNFWLLGSARISPLQQIEFMRKIHHDELPLRPATLRELKTIMHREDGEGYELYGKTGWSVDRGDNNGWFVGYAVEGERAVYVAVNIEPMGALDRKVFLVSRVEIAQRILSEVLRD